MRILVTGFTANYGGVEAFLMNYYRAMKKLDSTVVIDIISTAKEPAFKDELIQMGGQVHLISRAREKSKVKKELSHIMNENKYDVLWCNKCDLSDITYLEEAYKNKIPKRILHSHNSDNLYTGMRSKIVKIMHDLNKKKAMKCATEYWACSDYAANWMFNKDTKYTFVPNAVNAEKLRFNNEKREQYRADLGLKDKLVVGCVARISFQKNPEFIVDIFNEIHKSNENSVLLWAGTGELQEQIETKIKEYNIEKSVVFLGMRQDVSNLMQAMDCLLLPSRFEGLPVVAIEAQSAGLQVFASSEGISKQTKITESLKFLSLSQTAKQWTDEILKTDLTHKDTTEQIIKSGFEINSAAQNSLKKLGEIK
ncbi:MAG: glycosyltransferase [Clostridia bacterium]